MDEQGILNDLLQLYLADRASGCVRSTLDYQQLFPGHEQLIASELCALRAELDPNAAAPEEERFGPYRLLKIIGRGGQGTVYLAEDSRLGRRVALKMLTRWSAMSGDAVVRFRREAVVASRLDDPGLCTIFEAGSFEDTPFIAMRYVEGDTLATLIQEARDRGTTPDPEQAMRLVTAIASAAHSLHKAHEAGIVHRDIKPSNVMLARDGSTVVLDFGLAFVRDDQVTTLTQSGDVFGTPVYMSPEQISDGGRAADRRSDVYALGATLYECLTLHKAFAAPTRERLFEQIRFADARHPRELNPTIAEDLCVILAVAMDKDPNRRYQTCLDLAEDLRRVQRGEMVLARRPSRVHQLRRLLQRHAMLAGSVATVVLTLVAGLVATGWQAHRASAAEQLALSRLHDVERALARVETESHITRAVNDFLHHDLLQAATPEVARGADIKVREVLDDAARTISKRFQDQPLVEAAIRATVGGSYLSLDETQAAEPQLQRAFDLRCAELGEDSPEATTSRLDLALLREYQGRFHDAEELLQAVLHNSRSRGDVLESLKAEQRLASVCFAQGRYAEARSMYESVVRSYRATLGSEHRSTLGAIGGLSGVCDTLGDHEAAGNLCQEVLDTSRRCLGADDPDTLIALGNLAAHLTTRGLWDAAEAMMREDVAIGQRVFGPQHRHTLMARNNLAALLVYRGQYQAAEAMLLDLREECVRLLGAEHPQTLSVIANLGGLRNEQGRYQEAEMLVRQVVEVRTKTLGPEHQATLSTMTNLAFILRNEHQPLEAERWCLAALKGFEHRYGANHPLLLDTMSNLAATYTTQGRFADAEPLLERAVAICRATLGNCHHSTVTALKGLGEMYYFWRHLEQAEAAFVEAQDAAAQAFPEDYPDTFVILGGHARCLLLMKRYDEAETELLESYDGLLRVSGENHPDTRSAALDIVTLYREWGKDDEAVRWQARAAAPIK